MAYKNSEIETAAKKLRAMVKPNGPSVLRAPEFLALRDRIKNLPNDQKPSFGAELNQLRAELEELTKYSQVAERKLEPIDVTAPFDANSPSSELLPTELGSVHPITVEIKFIRDIFARMGFVAYESREIDDDYHMFTSLNFPLGHPARDEYDTFATEEGLVAPAHTSNMQNRILKEHQKDLEAGKPIAAIVPDRVFRNEDLDARHEHTFYQLEGIYVNRGVNAGHLVATIKTWLNQYFGKPVEIKIQPFYFPFTEPSFEFAASCVFCEGKGCQICSQSGWIELGGCGLIHPNVLKEAGIDPKVYSGFAFGFGIDRLVMIKYDIEDVRHFHSGNLKFLRQFS